MKPHITIFLTAALTFAGCAQYASISERRPQFRPVRAAIGALVSVEQRISEAMRQEKREPLVAMGELLTAAETAAQQLARNPDDLAAREDYNFAVARVLGTIKQAKLDPWTQPLRVPAVGGDFVLTRKPDPRKACNPALRKPMVVIGHSMGGCISRLLITDTDDEKLWLALAKKPPAEVQLSPESRKLFTDALIFRHRPEIGRVIFISAPLRGSDLASSWAGRIGSSIVKSPVTLLKAGSDVLKVVTFQAGDLKLKRMPNSVDTLAPNNRFVKAINTIPVTPGIPYHVISGDRGKGGNKDYTKPVMSDGNVPYWSSHMEGA